MYEGYDDSNWADVGRFHSKFGLDTPLNRGVGPRCFDAELMRFRIKFMLEELKEFIAGCGWVLANDDDGNLIIIAPNRSVIDHAQTFDALLDLVYVALGTAHLMGYPWQEGWKRVQQANMQKVRAKEDGSDSKRGSSFDVVKPPGWTPPDIESLLIAYGWDGNL